MESLSSSLARSLMRRKTTSKEKIDSQTWLVSFSPPSYQRFKPLVKVCSRVTIFSAVQYYFALEAERRLLTEEAGEREEDGESPRQMRAFIFTRSCVLSDRDVAGKIEKLS